MKKTALAITALTMLSGTAYSMDWTGAYAGGFAGYISAEPDYQEAAVPSVNVNPDMDGFTGGLLIGYNMQNGDVVYGIEADIGMADADAGPNINPPDNTFSAFDLDWTAHLRARVGKSVDKTLFFAAAGIATAGFNIDDTDPGFGDVDSDHVGWTLGLGVEHAYDKNLIVRIEYLHDEFNSEDDVQSTPGPAGIPFTTDPSADIVRIGLSYRF